MKNLFVKPKLEERKQALREKLEKEISETDSEWVKNPLSGLSRTFRWR